MPNARQTEVDRLVRGKFEDTYNITFKGKSPHGFHFLLENNGVKKHLKIVKTAYLKANEASEIDLLEAIESEHVIKLEEHNKLNDKYTYLLFPHINGDTLHQLRSYAWDETELNKLVSDVTEGLKDLKKAGITHRDIKPKNIIKDSATGKYIILDLGIGYFMEGPNRDNTKVAVGSGSKFYSAPEQFHVTVGRPYELTSLTDQFSLGVIVYEMATQIHPYITNTAAEEQVYATEVTSVTPRLLSDHSTAYSDKFVTAVARMLAVEPSDRFITLAKLKSAFGQEQVTTLTHTSRTYLQMPNEKKPEFIEFLTTHTSDVEGVVITCSDSLVQSREVQNLDIDILFDPKTYNLQNNEVGPQLVEALGISPATSYDILDLSSQQNQLLIGVHNLASKYLSQKIILPYFNIENADNMYLKFTKRIWREGKAFYLNNEMNASNIYGGLVIPYSVIIDANERSKVISQLMGSYDLDGVFVVFENASDKIATTVDVRYLEGLKHFSSFFESHFKDVIVHRTDISVLPFLNKAAYTTGWAKGSRHFMISGNGRRGTYKMKYFAPKLFTFIEEISTVRIIISFGGHEDLACMCNYCRNNDPLDTSYIEDEITERNHFFDQILELRSIFDNTTTDEKNHQFKAYLEEADEHSTRLYNSSSGVVSSEIIPSYVGLISLIDE